MDRRRLLVFLAIAAGFALLARGVAQTPLGPPPLPALANTEPGARVELALPDLAGQPRRLSEWHGQILLVNFWATWCSPCLEELPSLESVQQSLADEGLAVIGVSVDSTSPERIARYLETAGASFVSLHDEDGALAQRLGVRVYPTTLVLDRDGRLRLTVPSAWDWAHPDAQAWLRTLLAEAAPGSAH